MLTSKPLARFLLLAAILAALVPVQAQRPFSGTPEIEQALHKLNELGTFLMIAAHPDDERTSLLAYYARGRHMRAAYLSLTRGEGGQNLLGPEQGVQLGMIRTQELLDARRIDGAEQFFTRAIDFGFTKTAEETLQKWGHDRILSDIVWVIRKYRPDVVMLGFSGTPSDGHGQHQASAILGKEAYEVAGDPTKFPEQLKYVQPWKPKRLVRSSFGGGRGGPGGRGNAPPVVPAGSVNTGELNPVLGYSYEELATISRSMHYSQGTGAMRRPGPATVQFQLAEGEPATHDPFDGIDTSWTRLPGGAAVKTILDEAIRSFEPRRPEAVLPLLAKARPLIAAIDDPLAKIKLGELDETIALCAGMWVDAQARRPEGTPGSTLGFTTTVMNRSNAAITFEGAQVNGMWNAPIDAKPAKLGYNQSVTAEFNREVPPSQPYSQPYWLVKPPTANDYNVDDQTLIGLPETPPIASVRVKLTLDGTPFEVVRPVRYRYADRASGEHERPMIIVPPVAVNLTYPVSVFPTAEARKVSVSVAANVMNAKGTLRLDAPAGWKVEPASRPFEVATAGEQEEIAFTVTPPAGESLSSLRAVATVGGREISSGMDVIAYPHIPPQALFPAATIKLVRASIKTAVKNVGYIMGAGDAMPDALRQLGLQVTLISPSELEQGDLSKYDVIVAGIRAYNVRTDIRANQPRLLEYVRNGGTYVVQYHGVDAIGTPGQGPGGPGAPGGRGAAGGRGATATPAAAGARGAAQGGRGGAQGGFQIGPYPITFGGGNRYRITVEEAPVTFPHPDSPLLQVPNHIEPKDFEGWVQERGLYFATEWDPRYQTVLSSRDPGEEPLDGGELWTRYGKGVYIFTAYAWFRQLPAGVPGAYRLFANLISAK